MPGPQATSRWRFLITPRWLGWHLFVIAAVLGMLALGDWQLRRAEAGNALSWAYTFEWPLFAIFAVVFWAKTIKDEIKPPAPGPAPDGASLPGTLAAAGGIGQPGDPAGADGQGEPDEPDDELAAYNAYLARLAREVKGHGRWHGLR